MAKTKVDDINRNIYDVVDKDNYEFKMQKGLNREIVEEISKRKNEVQNRVATPYCLYLAAPLLQSYTIT